jgi:hypothetical protein
MEHVKVESISVLDERDSVFRNPSARKSLYDVTLNSPGHRADETFRWRRRICGADLQDLALSQAEDDTVAYRWARAALCITAKWAGRCRIWVISDRTFRPPAHPDVCHAPITTKELHRRDWSRWAKTRHGDYLPLANKDEASRDRPVMLVCGTPLHFLAEENCSARPSSIWNTVSTP